MKRDDPNLSHHLGFWIMLSVIAIPALVLEIADRVTRGRCRVRGTR